MAGIDKSKFVDEKPIIKAFQDINEALKETSKYFDKLVVDAGDLQKSLKNINGFEELIKAQKEYASLQDDAVKSQKAAIDLQNKEAKLRQLTADAILSEKRALAEDNKEARIASKEKEKTLRNLAKETSAYAQLSKAHIAARNTAKDLAVQYGLNSKEYKKAADEANKLDAQLKKIDSSLGQNQRNVGNYAKAIDLVKVGWAAVGASLIAAGKYVLDLNTKFSKASASLRAITGASREDMKFFEEQAKSMGKAMGVAGDEMLKSFERVGSIRPELLKTKEALVQVTQSAIVLSQASGGVLDLAGATEALGAGMNQFNLGAKDSERIINALAAGSQIGSAEVSSLAESFKNVGAVANNANMSLEDTVAALEVLGEKSLYGAEAGTKLRGTILKLQEAGKGFASGKFNLKDALTETKNELDAIANPMEKAAYLSKMFGIENQTAGIIMLQNIDKYTKFREGVEGTNTAFEQQKIQMDTISGAWDRLSVTWDNILTSGWFQESVKWIINFTNAMFSGAQGAQSDGSTTVSRQVAAFNEELKALEKQGLSSEEILGKLQKRLNDVSQFATTHKVYTEQYEIYKKNVEAQKELNDIALIRWQLSGKTTEALLLENAANQKRLDELNQIIGAFGEYDVERSKQIADTKLQIKAIDAEIAARNNLTSAVEKENIAKSGTKEPSRKKEDIAPMTSKGIEAFNTAEVDMVKANADAIIETEKWKNDKIIELGIEATEAEEKRLEELNEYKKQLANDAVSTGKELINTMFEVQQANYDREIQLIEDRATAQLDNENLTESQRKQIEAQRDADILKVEQKKRESQRKQFITNKAIALTEIAINTAKGIAATIGEAGFLGIPLSVLVGALGAAQAAVVLAQPMPAFDKGTNNAPSRDFLVAEKGPEFVTHNGKTELVTEPTVMSNMGGAVVTSRIETKKILENERRQMSRNLFSHKIDPESYRELVYETRELRRDIRNQKPVSIYAGSNVTTYSRQGHDLMVKKFRG